MLPTTYLAQPETYGCSLAQPHRLLANMPEIINSPTSRDSDGLSTNFATDYVTILSPPISPNMGTIEKGIPQSAAEGSADPAATDRVTAPNLSSTNGNNIVGDGSSSFTSTVTTSIINGVEQSAKRDARFPHNFLPMKDTRNSVYKPPPGTTEEIYRQLVEENRQLENSSSQPPFGDYNTTNFADSDTSTSIPMTSCIWNYCRSKGRFASESNSLDNYQRGVHFHDPYSLAVHSVSNRSKTSSASSNRNHHYHGATSQNPRQALPGRFFHDNNSSSSSFKPTNLKHSNNEYASGLSALGDAAHVVSKQERLKLAPIRTIPFEGSTVLPPVSTISPTASTSPTNSISPTGSISPSPYLHSASLGTPSYHPAAQLPPINSSKPNHSSTGHNPKASSNLRFVNSLSSKSHKVTKKTPRKSLALRKRTPPVLSRVHEMKPEEVPDYCISADTLAPGKLLRAEWKGTPMDLSKDPNYHKIHPAEVNLAATLRLSVELYLDSKKRLFAEKVHRFKQGLPFRRTDSQKACRIDVNKASRLFMAYEKVGWLDDSNFEKYKNEPLFVTSRQ